MKTSFPFRSRHLKPRPGWKQAWLARLLLSTLMIHPSVSVLLGNDLLLGRIVWTVDEASAEWSGPVRWKSDFAKVFEAYLREQGLGPESITSELVQKVSRQQHLIMVETTSGAAPMPAQWDAEPGGNRFGSGSLVWNSHRAPAGRKEFELRLRSGPSQHASMSVQDLENRHLLLSHGSQPVLRYNYGVVRERRDRTGPYDRACYFHPVWTPAGEVVTGDFSPEHIHQRGIFLAWRQARFGNVTTDFWGLGDNTGRLLPGNTAPKFMVGPVFARLMIHNQGVVNGKKVFDEQVQVTIYTEVVEEGRLFDVSIRQTLAEGVPALELPVIHYGGMSFRGPSEWLKQSVGDVQQARARGATFEGAKWLPADAQLDVLTSEGKDRVNGDRTEARWVDYTGPLGNGWGGLAMFDSPANPRYPTPLRLHPDLPYFSYALVQKEPFTVTRAVPLELSYRIWVHDGKPNRERNERLGQSFASAPNLVWLAPRE